MFCQRSVVVQVLQCSLTWVGDACSNIEKCSRHSWGLCDYFERKIVAQMFWTFSKLTWLDYEPRRLKWWNSDPHKYCKTFWRLPHECCWSTCHHQSQPSEILPFGTKLDCLSFYSKISILLLIFVMFKCFQPCLSFVPLRLWVRMNIVRTRGIRAPTLAPCKVHQDGCGQRPCS